MTINTAIIQAYLEATRKKVSVVTEIPTKKYNALLGLAFDLTKTWESEPGTDWMSRYERLDLGNITATGTFELDDTIRVLSPQEGDPIYVLVGTAYYFYKLVPPTKLFVTPSGSEDVLWGRNANICARQGNLLKFSRPFTTKDTQFGGKLNVPCFTYCDDVTSGTQDVQVDDPLWLIYMMAAEFIRNDRVKQGQYGNLVAKAQDRMNAMKSANVAQMEQMESLMDMTTLGESW